jgi:hypothetical protein
MNNTFPYELLANAFNEQIDADRIMNFFKNNSNVKMAFTIRSSLDDNNISIMCYYPNNAKIEKMFGDILITKCGNNFSAEYEEFSSVNDKCELKFVISIVTEPVA